jgi:hypothetical protein
MGWHKAALRLPEQFARWTWIVIIAITQLPPRFCQPGRARWLAGQAVETRQGRPRPPQRPPQHPSTPLRRDQESRLTRSSRR